MGRKLEGFQHVTERLQSVFGPATHGDTDTPVVHKHDDFETASEADLKNFDVETDSEGHHYAVRNNDPGPTSTDYSVRH
ncbi:hypothetical protein LN996_11280 [Arthrobacter sp. AK01]|uniref:hypothetical protein n=1 Tax=Arthrobacter sp. AK01 TaxID=2894084 RepID=UPI001E327449|nr:hypothetical protein [Arthrobacter sp. AK01]MCD4851395.1 hypothetical protein [Arthrobacter sp. AK01]